MGEACLGEHEAIMRNLDLAGDSAPAHLCHWYGLKVRTGGEFAVVAALRSRGFDPFCPTQKTRRRYSDRMKVVETAVFPGYIFCRLDLQRRLPVVSAPGVEYIVGLAGTAAPIPDGQIENLRRMVQAGASETGHFQRGQRVRVTHGALEGVEGVLVCDPCGDRLVVSIDLLNKSASLHIDQDQTSAIEPDPAVLN